MEDNTSTGVVSMRCLRHKKRFNVPKEWLETSKRLCPRCYEKLSDVERLVYAPRNGLVPEIREAETGKPTMLSYTANKNSTFTYIEDKDFESLKINSDNCWTSKSSLINRGGCWSNSRITSASESELKAAVKAGIVSKARMRIELRRRENSSYYDLFPIEVGLSTTIGAR